MIVAFSGCWQKSNFRDAHHWNESMLSEKTKRTKRKNWKTKNEADKEENHKNKLTNCYLHLKTEFIEISANQEEDL